MAKDTVRYTVSTRGLQHSAQLLQCVARSLQVFAHLLQFIARVLQCSARLLNSTAHSLRFTALPFDTIFLTGRYSCVGFIDAHAHAKSNMSGDSE